MRQINLSLKSTKVDVKESTQISIYSPTYATERSILNELILANRKKKLERIISKSNEKDKKS